MDEDLTIINSNTRKEKIKNFLVTNKKIISYFLTFILILIFIFFGYQSYSKSKIKNISDEYNSAIIEYSQSNKDKTKNILVNIVNKKNPTYSPLSLYFIIDNKLIKNKKDINDLFDILIDKTSLDDEIRYLIIYKKSLFNADSSSENELLKMLDPIIKSNSIWKSHALYLMAEFFYNKKQNQKAKEFFEKIIVLENSNIDIIFPMVSMNNSGEALKAYLKYSNVEASNILVIHDDIDLGFGRLRLKSGSSDGGHNGIKSINSYLQSNEYFRLKVGVGRPPKEVNPADFVLSRFYNNEEEEVEFLIEDSVDIIEMFIKDREIAIKAASERRIIDVI